MVAFKLREPPLTVADVEAQPVTTPIIAGDARMEAAKRTVSPHVTDVRDALAMIRREIDTYWVGVRGFSSMEPDQVLIALSAYTARVGEMRVRCWRDGSRLAQKLRTEEIDPFIEECDRQFKLHSRLQSVRELDWQMTRGAPT